MIETERLFLREYTMDDFDALYEIVSDAETMQHYPAPFDEEKTMDVRNAIFVHIKDAGNKACTWATYI